MKTLYLMASSSLCICGISFCDYNVGQPKKNRKQPLNTCVYLFLVFHLEEFINMAK